MEAESTVEDLSLHSGERPMPLGVNYLRHLVNYRFLAPFVANRKVLDVGCGTGYGAAALGKTAAQVVGVDVSAESVRYAAAHYGSRNVGFRAVGGEDLLAHFPPASFDAVTCIMVIEHIPAAEQFVQSVAALLAPGGLFCLATNNREVMSPKEHGFHFHEKEFTPAEMTAMLSPRFEGFEFYGLFESPRVRQADDVKAKGKAMFGGVTRADPIGLRKLVPAGPRKAIAHLINAFIQRRIAPLASAVSPFEIQESDFTLKAASYLEAEHFLCVARRRAGV